MTPKTLIGDVVANEAASVTERRASRLLPSNSDDERMPNSFPKYLPRASDYVASVFSAGLVNQVSPCVGLCVLYLYIDKRMASTLTKSRRGGRWGGAIENDWILYNIPDLHVL